MAAELTFVTGAVPGLGKSTLARSTAAWRRARFFAEEDIESDPSFADLWSEFERSGRVSASTLLSAAAKFVAGLDTDGMEAVVLDALFGYLPSLLAWGHSDESVLSFFGELDSVFGERPVTEIHLVGDTGIALERAISRQDDAWEGWMLEKLAGYDGAPPIECVDDAVGFLASHAVRSRAILERAPWRVVFVNADAGAEAALEDAVRQVWPD